MRVLVCGAGGFIGGWLTARLLAEGHTVRAVDMKERRDWWQYHEAADNWPCCDLRFDQYCDLVVDRPFDRVFDLACRMGGIGWIETQRVECMLSTLNNTRLLWACQKAGVKRYFYSSSACIYHAERQQAVDVPPLKEEHSHVGLGVAPERGYGEQKWYHERLCAEFAKECGMDVRVARFHNAYGPCYDDATEVLTEDGWRLFCELQPSDKIASRSAVSDKIEYVPIVEFQQYPYSGPVYTIDHSALNQVVTPDHALFATWPTTRATSDTYTPPFARHKASDTKWDRARMYFTSRASWDGVEMPDSLVLPACGMEDGRTLHPEKTVAMGDWFDFIGWYISEGSSWITPTNYTVCISQSPGPKTDQILALVRRMGFTTKANGKNIVVSNKQLYKAVQEIGIHGKAKRIPRWMLKAPPELLERLFASLMAGDGDADGGRYSTVSEGLANDMMELCLKLGKHAWIGCEQRKYCGISRPICRVHISNRPRLVTKPKHRRIREYAGMVYDVTLEKNHIMMVRRNGRPVWSGNCGSWNDGHEKAPAAMCRKVIEAKHGNRRGIEIWGDGRQTRSFMYVDDCVEGILRLTESDVTEPLNIGSSELVTINELVDIAEDLAGVKLTRVYDLTKPKGVRGRNSDNTKIKALLGWEPKTALRDGMAKTFAWIEQEYLKRKDV